MKSKCPLNHEYIFLRCSVETCKNHSPVTKTRCMLVDRKESSTQKISDQELQYYKAIKSKSSVLHLKRKAEERIVCLIILDGFLAHCVRQKPFTAKKIQDSILIKDWFRGFPFNSGLWDLPLEYLDGVTSTRNFNAFKRKSQCEKGSTILLHKVLGLKPEMFHRIRRIIRKARRDKNEN